MKRVLFTIACVLVVTLAQVLAAPAQSKDVRNASVSENSNNVAPSNGKKGKKDKSTADASDNSQNQSETDKAAATVQTSTASATTLSGTNNGSTTTTDAPTKTVTTVPGESITTTSAPALTSIYRVGVGDVLDIRLLNAPTRDSTLYTVLVGGILEYPLAGDPLQVTGLTTDEIDQRLTALVKLYDKPDLVVSVREYASHNVIVTGLVSDPGMKVLRREAVPLYVVLAEAQPRPEAARAHVMRQGSQSMTIDLSDANASNTLIYPGDVIKLIASPPPPPQFVFIGGQVNSPGQKNFHAGLTLTQAIIVAGGTTRFAGSEVKVSRQGKDGLLVTTKYNLKKIEDGKAPDPVLEAGDRLEVGRSGW